MSIFFAFIQALLIFLIFIYEYKQKSPVLFLWGTLFLMFGLSHFFTVTNETSIYPSWVLDTASIFVILFCSLYLVFRFFLTKIYKKEEELFKPINNLTKSEIRFSRYFFIILISTIVIRVCRSLLFSGSLLNTSWSDNFANASIFDVIVLWFYFASAGLVLYSMFAQKKKLAIYTIIIMFICVIISRNRITILPIFIGLLSYYIYNSKLSLKKIVYLSFSGVMVVYIVYALLVFRHSGSIISFLDSFNFTNFNTILLSYILDNQGELALKDVFYFFIYNDNNFNNFGEGHTYIRILLMMVPSGILEGIKPPDFALSMGAAVQPGLIGFSTHPTLFGDSYANFGMSGVFLGVFWSIYVSSCDIIIHKTRYRICKFFYYSLFACTFVIIGRGSVYNAASLMLWGGIIIFILSKFSFKVKL